MPLAGTPAEIAAVTALLPAEAIVDLAITAPEGGLTELLKTE